MMETNDQKDPRGGHNVHVPTVAQRAQVQALLSYGVQREEIAKYIGIAPMTLAKHYQKEIDTAVIHANAQVAAKLYRNAVHKEDQRAIEFWLKTRGGWKNADNNEASKALSIVEQLLSKNAQKDDE